MAQPKVPGPAQTLRKIELGVLVTLVMAAVAFAFWLGTLNQRIASLESGDVFKRRADEAVEQARRKTTKMVAEEGGLRAVFYVSASRLWVDSEVRVSPGTRLRIRASGLANCALHRMIQAAERQEYPPFEWCDADGLPGGDISKEKPLYARRRDVLVLPNAPYGKLLMYIAKNSADVPSKFNPRPEGVIPVGSKFSHEYSDRNDNPGKLFFVINDTAFLPDEKYKDGYVGTQAEIDATYGKGHYTVARRDSMWRRLRDLNYTDVWFADNGGGFLVEVFADKPLADGTN